MKSGRSFNPTFFLSISIILLLVLEAGCSRKKSTEVSATKLDSLKTHFEFLESELALNWSVMIEDDDEKLFSMKRLLEEISYTGAYNEKQYNQLMEEVESLAAIRYDQISMKDGNLIDQYDNQTQKVVSDVIEFAQNHPKYEEYQLMEELVNEIMEAQYNVLNYRIHYDNSADDFNNFVSDNQDIINQITNHDISPKAVFRIE